MFAVHCPIHPGLYFGHPNGIYEVAQKAQAKQQTSMLYLDCTSLVSDAVGNNDPTLMAQYIYELYKILMVLLESTEETSFIMVSDSNEYFHGAVMVYAMYRKCHNLKLALEQTWHYTHPQMLHGMHCLPHISLYRGLQVLCHKTPSTNDYIWDIEKQLRCVDVAQCTPQVPMLVPEVSVEHVAQSSSLEDVFSQTFCLYSLLMLSHIPPRGVAKLEMDSLYKHYLFWLKKTLLLFPQGDSDMHDFCLERVFHTKQVEVTTLPQYYSKSLFVLHHQRYYPVVHEDGFWYMWSPYGEKPGMLVFNGVQRFLLHLQTLEVHTVLHVKFSHFDIADRITPIVVHNMKQCYLPQTRPLLVEWNGSHYYCQETLAGEKVSYPHAFYMQDYRLYSNVTLPVGSLIEMNYLVVQPSTHLLHLHRKQEEADFCISPHRHTVFWIMDGTLLPLSTPLFYMPQGEANTKWVYSDECGLYLSVTKTIGTGKEVVKP
jgi:hypothetical protein